MNYSKILPGVLGLVLASLSGTVYAQSTTGALTGEAPAGTTISIESDRGLEREVTVDERGHYLIQQLPLGTYKVVLKRAGQVVETREDVALTVGANTEVSFIAPGATLETVTVSANKVPSAIDVRSVDSRTVITSDDLQRLPLGYNSEAIAKLAPGVVGNGAGFTSPTGESVVSFGGASAAENAYYINGFNTTDPLNGLGGLTLPYDAIDQQEIFTGGFSAKYGRSAGGVINAIGKRGTNQWKFGGQVSWEPNATREDEKDVYYPGNGDLYDPDSRNKVSVVTKSATVGGPIIQDKLFFFGAYELETREGDTVHSVQDTNAFTSYKQEQPRWYAKLDWNITDSHLLEFTGASSKYKTRGTIYEYDFAAREKGALIGSDDSTRNGGTLWNAKYTGYLTDNLTVSALYGRSSTDEFIANPAYDPSLIFVDGISFQNPALNGGEPVRNAQTTQYVYDPDQGYRNDSLRLDINYVLNRHNITVGIDNQNSRARNHGQVASGPDGFNWVYGQADPGTPLESGLGVPATGDFPNGAEGYFVDRQDLSFKTTVKLKQTAQYIEDNWQVTDSFLLSLGLRLDQFTNYNGDGDPYIKQTSGQWAPRLGFSWNVQDDARFRVFGNAGRYYLALPLTPAFGAAGAVLQTDTYFTYAGIDENGYPTGLTQMADPVSALNHFGNAPDPKIVATQGIEPSYQDELILGFSKMAGDTWVYGAKATYRTLKSGVDDFCNAGFVLDKATELGYSMPAVEEYPVSCWLFNPGRTNNFVLLDTTGNYVSVPLSPSELGLPKFKRDYYALNLALEHRLANKWYGKIDYTFSRSYGTTEGQVQSTIQQNGAGVTIDWDNAAVMEHTNGPQNNDHTHQFKLYGYYEFNPQWLASANFAAVSGAPKSTLGFYGDPENPDPAGYGSYYHYYQGQPAPPGSQGRFPWLTQLDVGVTYRPSFADGNLKFGLDVFNLLNRQAPLWRSPYSELEAGVQDPLFGAIILRQAPRSLRFGVSFNY